MLPPDDWVSDRAQQIAAWLAAIGTGGFWMFKARLKARSDLRTDSGAETSHVARNDVIELLRSEVERLATQVRTMSEDGVRERLLRREAEDRAFNAERRALDLVMRVEALEAELLRTKGLKP